MYNMKYEMDTLEKDLMKTMIHELKSKCCESMVNNDAEECKKLSFSRVEYQKKDIMKDDVLMENIWLEKSFSLLTINSNNEIS
ncbi:hypothetical protein DASC09_011220 [Saccharomycopsis crataegensis]|uniref:Uncharacterized protein n=1 Tax=Saccharomycopsis crataegensis TaxID=43959 RepID=A0AAV5QGS6_9ASCO|nr:hypothetical protein DASC09_011220 [Saccharomycopsis crataegensis]